MVITSLHHFDEFTIRTELLPTGDWTAIDEDSHDIGWPVGCGTTRWAAIVDLMSQLNERGLLPESALR